MRKKKHPALNVPNTSGENLSKVIENPVQNIPPVKLSVYGQPSAAPRSLCDITAVSDVMSSVPWNRLAGTLPTSQTPSIESVESRTTLSDSSRPLSDFSQPPSGFSQPPSDFSQPPSGFRQPPSDFSQPPSGFRQPPSDFSQPPSGFRQPPSGFSQPPSAQVTVWFRFALSNGPPTGGAVLPFDGGLVELHSSTVVWLSPTVRR